MEKETTQITEEQLAEDFEKVQREITEQIRKYELTYPELANPARGNDEVVQQPIYTYEISAVS